jgi:DNA repair protein RadA
MVTNTQQELEEEQELEHNQLEEDLAAAEIEEALLSHSKSKSKDKDKDKAASEVVEKYDFIEDLPGVGPATANKLRELGYKTVEAVAMATIRELEGLGVSEKKAFQVIQAARSTIGASYIRADVLLKRRQSVARLSTGCKALDNLVAGGLETQSITEFYGEYGSGKSQVCHQLCVNVQLPVEKGGLNGGVLYIDTENTFRLERIVQMATHMGLNPEEVVKNIIYAEAYTSDHQMFLLENSDDIIKANNIKLIIVDSLMAHFRSEYIGRETLATRQQKLNKHMHKLNALARAFNAVAVVTNQVMAKPDQFFGDPLVPIGGNIVGHTSQTRIALRRGGKGEARIAKLVSSPYLPDGEVVMKVTQNGIEDVTEEEQAARTRGR